MFMVSTIVTFLVTGLFSIINFFVGLLPSFSLDLSGYLSGISDYVGYLNWFFPVQNCVNITAVWVTALAVYRAYLAFAGFFKVFAGASA